MVTWHYVVSFFAATSIKFKIIGPQNDGGIPVKAYIVQYKDARHNWMDAMNKTWTYGKLEFGH